MPFHWKVADLLARRGGRAAAEARALEAPKTIPAMIDSLFDYQRFIETVDKDRLAAFPGDLPEPESVAIIGARTGERILPVAERERHRGRGRDEAVPD
jgi:hypothetical protein